ncbi:LLM class flavin-dependent oxidoreductase [Compostimonas suwonensis]|uniref:Alkanesulfonate monooxygenase SsuD/methylene tetrahydromethanopterin reductase-like flavin-dependent oxidoreductase (Luciferase family) n=1 Tax=Compostimonas suwonensis TaxID=1048394 RepID=A0A2M9BVZ2_9MICO|nr:LLM class flavin-dependent oxidoreductase [Compostimonas suwonensis]PJJ62128.1 alkanesulfonate monooxygenase SsuD/methylene tetrahydromethanopterin reductase-like flavin-dependent oxidoreductase (luciferase family) [Compostimonas suwonensis]
MTAPLHLAVALDGTGWHPAAWRDAEARPDAIFGLPYWTGLVRRAEEAGIDLVTFEDAVGLQTGGYGPVENRTDEVRGRLDALLLASAVAPRTSRIGLVPTVTTTHTEPFHVSTGLATLDHASRGRAGWRVQVSGRAHEAAHFGRRTIPALDPLAAATGDPAHRALLEQLFGEARDSVEVVRRLWDSWQDDAVIRDTRTGRFIDRDRLHHIDFEGESFSVKGPSITPRPPQGQPPVYVLAHQEVPYRLAATSADIVGITPHDDEQLASVIAEVRAAEAQEGREANPEFAGPLRIWAELVILIEHSEPAARDALEHLDELHGSPYASDALVVAGTAAAIVERLERWQALGIEGVRLRPARLPRDLDAIADEVVPLLGRAGLLERPADATTLRARLGLPEARNRYERRGGAASAETDAVSDDATAETDTDLETAGSIRA